jgi:hypothetical protein
MSPDEIATPNASIELNIAKLSVLMSRFLSSLCLGRMSSEIQENLFNAIEVWASKLPHNLRYFPSIDSPQSSQADEVGSVSEHSGLKVDVRLTTQA